MHGFVSKISQHRYDGVAWVLAGEKGSCGAATTTTAADVFFWRFLQLLLLLLVVVLVRRSNCAEHHHLFSPSESLSVLVVVVVNRSSDFRSCVTVFFFPGRGSNCPMDDVFCGPSLCSICKTRSFHASSATMSSLLLLLLSITLIGGDDAVNSLQNGYNPLPDECYYYY